MDNPNAYYYIGGRKIRIAEANCRSQPAWALSIRGTRANRTAGQLWMEAIEPLLRNAAKRMAMPPGTRSSAKYDQYSTREFLEASGWSEGAIEMYGLLANQEAVMNSSFLEVFREDFGQLLHQHGGDRRRHRPAAACLPAGTQRQNIRFGAKMIAIDQSPDDVTMSLPDGRRPDQSRRVTMPSSPCLSRCCGMSRS